MRTARARKRERALFQHRHLAFPGTDNDAPSGEIYMLRYPIRMLDDKLLYSINCGIMRRCHDHARIGID